MLENPQIAKNLIYDYRGMKIKGTRNEAGWNSVYVAGQIIKKNWTNFSHKKQRL